MTIGEKMSNESVNQDVKQESVSDNVKNPTVNQDDKQNMIPQARFSEHVAKSNAKMEEMSNIINSYKAKEEAARKKQLEEQGNYKQLIDEQTAELTTLREFKTTVDTQMAEKKDRLIKQLIAEQESELSTLRTFKADMDTKIAEKRERLIKQLPEEQRAIYGELSVDALEQHINMSNNNMNKVPTNTQQPKRVGNQEFGGYSSWIEFAQKDPAGAEKAIQQHNAGRR